MNNQNSNKRVSKKRGSKKRGSGGGVPYLTELPLAEFCEFLDGFEVNTNCAKPGDHERFQEVILDLKCMQLEESLNVMLE